MRCTIVAAGGPIDRCGIRKLDRLASHLALAQPAQLCDPLRRMAVQITACKVHPCVGIGRILAQRLLDQAHRLDKFAPIHRSQHPQAADAVTDRHLIGRLLLALRLHQLDGSQAGFREPLFDPRKWQGESRPPALQAAHEFGDKRAGQRRVRARHVGDHQDQALRIVLDRLHHLVGPGCGPASFDPPGRDAHADATQILDYRQPQHDRNRPQFAELERGDALVGRHEASERLRIDPPVAVRDALQRDVVDPGPARRGPLCKAREFAAVAFGKVALGGPDLLFDEVEIVEQPIASRCDPALLGGRAGQQGTHLDQHTLVRGQSWQELVGSTARRQAVRGGKCLAVQFHLLGAEQLRPQRRFLKRRRWSRDPCLKARFHPSQLLAKPCAVLQIWTPLKEPEFQARASRFATGCTTSLL